MQSRPQSRCLHLMLSCWVQFRNVLLHAWRTQLSGGCSSYIIFSWFFICVNYRFFICLFLCCAILWTCCWNMFWIANRCKVTIQAADSYDNKSTEAEKKAQKTISGALYTIWKREGLLGFFNGLQAQILKTVLSSALLLMVKEKITKSTWILMLMIGRYFSANPPKLKASWIRAQ